MIETRINKLPCTFENQNFTFKIDQFELINKLTPFVFQLERTVGYEKNEVGEKLHTTQ